MKKIFSVIKNIIIAILLVILIFNLIVIIKSKLKPNDIPGLFGYKPLVVLSGSMQSAINVGDLVIVKDTDITKLKENDIIAFKVSGKEVVTHRIMNVIKDGSDRCFETKGDSNSVIDDNLVCNDKVVGKYATKIPKLGNFVMFIQKPVGFALIMVVILSASAVIYLIENNRATKELLKDKEKELSKLKK